jgi:hypothetical protein
VYFESGLKINRHAQETMYKCRNLFSSLSSVTKAKWGLERVATRTPYKRLFVLIIFYTASDWSNLLNDKARRTLIRSQRMVLLQVMKVYRTTSTETLQVIAGVLLIDLPIEARARLHQEKRGHDEGSSSRSIMREAFGKWRERWQATQKCRTTFDYFDKSRIDLRAAE